MADVILLFQLGSTLAMVGIIWFVQIAHYPLMVKVGASEFCRYEEEHQKRTTVVVAPLMLIEATTAVLLFWIRPDAVPLSACITGVVLLAVLWLSTYLWQVPLHTQLAREYRPEAIQRLVRSNWLRTLAWSARGGVVLWMVRTHFSSAH